MFRDQRLFGEILKDFEQARTDSGVLEVGLGWCTDRSDMQKCASSWLKFSNTRHVTLWEDEVYTNLMPISDSKEESDLYPFVFIFGKTEKANAFHLNAHRAGELLLQEKFAEPLAISVPLEFFDKPLYAVLLSKMFNATPFALFTIERVSLCGCELHIFRDANQSAIEALTRLNDLPAQAGQGIPANGPHDGYLFVWDEVPVTLPPTPWQVVKFLWHKVGRKAPFDEVLDAIWGEDKASEVSSNNKIRSVQSKIQTLFSDKKHSLENNG